MAKEITVVVGLNVTKSNVKIRLPQESKQIDMAGSNYSVNTQTIPTTAGGTALVIAAGVATLGVARIKNLDLVNYITIGIVVSAAFYPVVKLKAGELYSLRLVPGVTYYALANTASVQLEHVVVED
jgi:hypothetical protein